MTPKTIIKLALVAIAAIGSSALAPAQRGPFPGNAGPWKITYSYSGSGSGSAQLLKTPNDGTFVPYTKSSAWASHYPSEDENEPTEVQRDQGMHHGHDAADSVEVETSGTVTVKVEYTGVNPPDHVWLLIEAKAWIEGSHDSLGFVNNGFGDPIWTDGNTPRMEGVHAIRLPLSAGKAEKQFTLSASDSLPPGGYGMYLMAMTRLRATVTTRGAGAYRVDGGAETRNGNTISTDTIYSFSGDVPELGDYNTMTVMPTWWGYWTTVTVATWIPYGNWVGPNLAFDWSGSGYLGARHIEPAFDESELVYGDYMDDAWNKASPPKTKTFTLRVKDLGDGHAENIEYVIRQHRLQEDWKPGQMESRWVTKFIAWSSLFKKDEVKKYTITHQRSEEKTTEWSIGGELGIAGKWGIEDGTVRGEYGEKRTITSTFTIGVEQSFTAPEDGEWILYHGIRADFTSGTVDKYNALGKFAEDAPAVFAPVSTFRWADASEWRPAQPSGGGDEPPPPPGGDGGVGGDEGSFPSRPPRTGGAR